MWVIDCSPLPDKAECGRAGNWATQAKREREGFATGQISTTCLPTLAKRWLHLKSLCPRQQPGPG